MIPVSSELENDHFKSWVRIAYFMNAVAIGQEKTSHALIKILENIKRFDKESHDKKIVCWGRLKSLKPLWSNFSAIIMVAFCLLLGFMSQQLFRVNSLYFI
jgi:hypothetical protein